MAQSGYTPISLYYSTTASAAPLAANLNNGELGINITDGKLYYKDNAGVVQLIASKAAAAGQVTVTNANNLSNTGAVSTNSTYYVSFFGNNTTSYQGSNTSAVLSLNPSTGTLYVGPGTALGGTTNPLVAMSGSTNNYVQSYVYNASSGVSASADFVAYGNNSTDAHGWADLGFTSSGYADTTYTVTGANEAYILGSAPSGSTGTGNLVYATDSTGTQNYHQWYVGGFTQSKSAYKMQLTSTGLAVVGTLSATGDVTFSSTGAVQVPSGTTAQQPTGVAGKLRFNTTTGTFEGYNGTSWGAIGGAPSGAYTRTNVTATAGQTTFTGLSYQVGYIQVYLNGVLLDPSDYTATSGTSVVLGTAAASGDIVSFVVLTISGVGNATNISGGAANQIPYQSAPSTTTFSSGLTFDGTTFTATALAGPLNGTVGATTPNTGAFTTLSASSTVSGTGFSNYLASPPSIGSTAANTGAFTTLSASSTVTLSGGTANGIAYLNGSKVVTSGSALTFDGTNFATTGSVSDSIGNVRTIVQNSQTTGYTLVATDNGKHISITTGGVTVPQSIFSAGQNVVIFNNSASSQTITQGTGVTLYFGNDGTTGNRTLGARGLCTVLCVASNTFVITGAGLT